MLERIILPTFCRAMEQYPVVTVTGPRQVGKTTLVRSALPEKPYFNLERPTTRQMILEDPVEFLRSHPQGAIFDEVQRLPELLSYIQAEVDERQQMGLYVLTGSHQTELHQAISQSLAGRTAVLHLLPLSMEELGGAGNGSLDERLLSGFLPAIYERDLAPMDYYRNYTETYLERDLRTLVAVKDMATFQRFLKLLAGRVGQVLNKHSLAQALGVSSHTVEHWLSILQASYLVTLLPPYFENFGKRVIKSPKLYFFDVGLAAYLQDIDGVDQLSGDLRGHLFENMVVMELYKYRLNRGMPANLYYYRDSQQHEVDVVYKRSNILYPIEVKSSGQAHRAFFQQLGYFARLVGKRLGRGYLVYSGDSVLSREDGFSVLNYADIGLIFDQD